MERGWLFSLALSYAAEEYLCCTPSILADMEPAVEGVLEDRLDALLKTPEASVVRADIDILLRASLMLSMASLDSLTLRARRSPTFSASRGSLHATLNMFVPDDFTQAQVWNKHSISNPTARHMSPTLNEINSPAASMQGKFRRAHFYHTTSNNPKKSLSADTNRACLPWT